MSLASLLNTNSTLQKAIREVTPLPDDFYSNTAAAPFKNKNILAEAQFTSYVSGLIRTSFQYLACAMIARENGDSPDAAFNPYIAKGHEVINEFFEDVPETAVLNELYADFKSKWTSFIHGEQMDPAELIAGAFMCSKLDTIYRVGVRSTYTSTEQFVKQFTSLPTPDVMEDLLCLIEIFKEHFTTIQGQTVYYPAFDHRRRLVGGAQADVIVDGTLYEMKTSKKAGYAWKEAAELLGYYLLNKIEGEPYPIRRLAFYKARFGSMEYVDVDWLENNYDLDHAARMLSKARRYGY
ncbi:hypothetical protein ACFSVM_06400 [Paenibacillus shunpengii]|uniref:PD-(D/E)XK nuclease superfamily protein n=1 Tax=Paenibacillus shunpengii TaxID=2054424 RepID=A0ABW5SJY2_9BACL